jgi:hypothetical protein
MEDFEQAVESGTLPSFLKQDLDLDLTSDANRSGTIAEAELEKLMREMSEGDLDKLAGEIGVDPIESKVGLINEPAIPTTTSPLQSGFTQPLSASSRKNSLAGGSGVNDKRSRVSIEEKAEVAREIMTAGTVDGLMKAVEKAEGKEKMD